MADGSYVDTSRGFIGDVSAWDTGSISMEGGAVQMDSVFSWNTLERAGIITNVSDNLNIPFVR